MSRPSAVSYTILEIINLVATARVRDLLASNCGGKRLHFSGRLCLEILRLCGSCVYSLQGFPLMNKKYKNSSSLLMLRVSDLWQALGKVELDVRGGEESIDAAVGRAWNIFGKIDVLIYCSTVPGT